MVECLQQELAGRLEIEDMKEINWEVTRKLQAEEKYVKFHEWLKANGAKYDSVEYPVAFGKGGNLIGIAARRDIGPEEAYLYIPTKLTINDEKIMKSEIGFIVEKHADVFKEHFDGEYLRLIFFVTYELGKGDKSFWGPYFNIAQRSDLPCYWTEEEIAQLEDELLKAEIKEYKEEMDAEYEALLEIASLYPEVINVKEFTRENFDLAFTVTVTRCFGWSLPSTMIIPFADCANHFIIDNQYEMVNPKLHRLKDRMSELGKNEETYYTPCKMRINVEKHFQEDGAFQEKMDVPYKTLRYIKKIQMRESCTKLTAQQFLTDPAYSHMQVWDLKYLSTSDEEDNDSSESESESEEDEEEEKTSESPEKEKPKLWKEDTPGKNEHVPQIAKKLRPAKKRQRVYFAYSYDNKTGEGQPEPQKSLVVRKRVEKRQPENLIDILVMQKAYLYEKEQKMKILKEQDEEELAKIGEEYNSSDEEDDEENFAWYKDEDSDTYFVLCTKYKNTFHKGQQIFHCYGRRTNRFLLLNYGFCLNNNKYNSLSFRVWVNFNWQEERKKDQERQSKGALSIGDPSKSDSEDDDNRISKIIRLKKNRISEEILAYLRANLLNTYKGRNLEHLLVSSPVDTEFEMLVVACTINLLKGLLTSRFKTPLEEDQALLADPALPIRKRFAILHRMNAKDILNANITLCNILMRILARFDDGKDFKRAYMSIVDSFETEEEIMLNRIRLRKYLRELVINQKRVLNAAKDDKYASDIQRILEHQREYQLSLQKKAEAKPESEEEEEEESEYESEDDETDQTKDTLKTDEPEQKPPAETTDAEQKA